MRTQAYTLVLILGLVNLGQLTTALPANELAAPPIATVQNRQIHNADYNAQAPPAASDASTKPPQGAADPDKHSSPSSTVTRRGDTGGLHADNLSKREVPPAHDMPAIVLSKRDGTPVGMLVPISTAGMEPPRAQGNDTSDSGAASHSKPSPNVASGSTASHKEGSTFVPAREDYVTPGSEISP